MERQPVNLERVKDVLGAIEWHLNEKIQKHGDGAFVSNHETFGAITEEYYELLEELRRNNDKAFYRESLDLIVAILWGILSNERSS
jgi:hypothetical protein